MIIFGDDNVATYNRPWGTYLIMILCVLVYIYELTLTSETLGPFMKNFAVMPASIVQSEALWTLFTSAFLHADIFHLIFNLLFVYVFSDNIELTFGSLLFALFYIGASICSSLIQVVSDPTSTIFVVGASGAIAGLMGAYFVLYPKSKIKIWLLFSFKLNAWLYLLTWILLQCVSAYVSANDPENQSIAWYAHIGGFVFGTLFAFCMVKTKLIKRKSLYFKA